MISLFIAQKQYGCSALNNFMNYGLIIWQQLHRQESLYNVKSLCIYSGFLWTGQNKDFSTYSRQYQTWWIRSRNWILNWKQKWSEISWSKNQSYRLYTRTWLSLADSLIDRIVYCLQYKCFLPFITNFLSGISPDL